jgi:hypothetical protein
MSRVMKIQPRILERSRPQARYYRRTCSSVASRSFAKCVGLDEGEACYGACGSKPDGTSTVSLATAVPTSPAARAVVEAMGDLRRRSTPRLGDARHGERRAADAPAVATEELSLHHPSR